MSDKIKTLLAAMMIGGLNTVRPNEPSVFGPRVGAPMSTKDRKQKTKNRKARKKAKRKRIKGKQKKRRK